MPLTMLCEEEWNCSDGSYKRQNENVRLGRINKSRWYRINMYFRERHTCSIIMHICELHMDMVLWSYTDEIIL